MTRFELRYDAQKSGEPVLAMAISDTGCLVNIIHADVEAARGMMVISVLGGVSCEKKIVGFLKKKGVRVKSIKSAVKKNEKRCVDCGACAGICPTGAIEMSDGLMSVDLEKCVRCGECSLMCPTRALTMKD